MLPHCSKGRTCITSEFFAIGSEVHQHGSCFQQPIADASCVGVIGVKNRLKWSDRVDCVGCRELTAKYLRSVPFMSGQRAVTDPLKRIQALEVVVNMSCQEGTSSWMQARYVSAGYDVN